MSKRGPTTRICHVAALDGETLLLWQFQTLRSKLSSSGKHTFGEGQVPPVRLVTADWPQLFQPRITVGWLPGRDVFVRVLQLPKSTPEDIASMVELQLERLSPMPVSHVCWAVETCAHADPEQVTAVVTLASRDRVEKYLELLEGKGIRADRLDVAWVRQLARLPERDGLWIVLGTEAEIEGHLALVAWRVEGVLREAAMWRLPASPEDASKALIEQLTHVAWAAEMEGWITEPLPKICFAMSQDLEGADTFRPALEEWSGQPVLEESPMGWDDLALASAQEHTGSQYPSLMPTDISQRYRQDFVDRLWVRGLGGLGMAYLFFVVVMLGALNWRRGNHDDLRMDVRSLGQNYTNVTALSEQVAILEEQVNLRFAALDCWQASIEKLPASLTLTSMNFVGGHTFTLQGSAPANAQSDVTAFNAELQRVVVRGQPLFASVEPAQISQRGSVGIWSFKAELRRMSNP